MADHGDMERVIVLDKEYTLSKDYRSWLLTFRKDMPGKKDPTKRVDHAEQTYYPTLEVALKDYLDKRLKVAKEIKDIPRLIEEAMNRIEKAVRA